MFGQDRSNSSPTFRGRGLLAQNWLNKIVTNYDDELTEEELKEIEEVEARMAKGEYIDLNDLKKEYGL
ncbi:MAG: hypothetical protein CVV03_12765 [Firmicutes bacterium HGW-Firmicutes-8]|nr:MAG: hypothetical protein CVV03_12765 [Firmicutes bacterium HGW-Firmicutes-8]